MFVTGKTIPTLVPCHLPEFFMFGKSNRHWHWPSLSWNVVDLLKSPKKNIVIPDNPSRFPIFGGLSSWKIRHPTPIIPIIVFISNSSYYYPIIGWSYWDSPRFTNGNIPGPSPRGFCARSAPGSEAAHRRSRSGWDPGIARVCWKPLEKKTRKIPSLWIQTLSEKVLKPPNHSKLYHKHFLRRYLVYRAWLSMIPEGFPVVPKAFFSSRTITWELTTTCNNRWILVSGLICYQKPYGHGDCTNKHPDSSGITVLIFHGLIYSKGKYLLTNEG